MPGAGRGEHVELRPGQRFRLADATAIKVRLVEPSSGKAVGVVTYSPAFGRTDVRLPMTVIIGGSDSMTYCR